MRLSFLLLLLLAASCTWQANTQEFSSANPVFVAYVADTSIVHNTIHDSQCALSTPLGRPNSCPAVDPNSARRV